MIQLLHIGGMDRAVETGDKQPVDPLVAERNDGPK
jgi:hypothetical protein